MNAGKRASAAGVRAPAGAEAATPAIARLLQDYRGLMARNEAGAVVSGDIEALHDFRVALRRARTLVKHFGDLFAPAAMARLRRDLSWLARASGSCRDWDVFVEQFDQYAARLPMSAAVAKPVNRVLLNRQRHARAQLKRALRAGRYEQLKTAWLALTPSRAATDGASPALDAVVYDRLREHAGTVFHEARRIGVTAPMKRLHSLRKDCKELRYMLDAFQAMLPAEDGVQHQRKELKQMQESLGALCDLDVQHRLLQECRKAWPARADPAGMVWMGKLGRLMRELQRAARKSCAEGARHFARKKNRRWYERLGEPPHEGAGVV